MTQSSFKAVVKKQYKRSSYSLLGVGLLLTFALTYGLPLATRCRHALSKLVDRMEMKVSAWHGVEPKLLSLSGRIIAERPRRHSLKGAQVEALDSKSGWASLTNERGDFVLRDVTWYPSATYSLIVQPNPYQARQINITGPRLYPDGSVVELGELNFDDGCFVEADELPGRNSISYLEFDQKNLGFYRECFEVVTKGKRTDEAKIAALSCYVATKLDLYKTNPQGEPARSILENGSAFCGKLALALATLAEAADYRARLVDVIYEAPQVAAHMVTEVFYQDSWHLYDPTSSAARDLSDRKQVAGYKELRLNPTLTLFQLREHLPSTDSVIGADIYRSGLYHCYYLRRGR